MLADLIGGIISTRKGNKQIAEGEKSLELAKSKFPDFSDNRELVLLDELERKSDSYYTGSKASLIKDDIGSGFASVKEGALSLASGGGADVNSLIGISNSQSNAYNNALSFFEERGVQRDAMEQSLLSDIVQKELELRLLDYSNERYKGESLVSAGEQNKEAGKSAITGFFSDLEDLGMSFLSGGLSSIAKAGNKRAKGSKSNNEVVNEEIEV